MNAKQNQLKIYGYTIPIKVSHVLREKSSEVIEAYGLLDTGASSSCVDFQIVKDLRLKPIRKQENVTTPFSNKNETVFKCPLKFTFQEIDINISAFYKPEHNLKLVGCKVLIGRDILQYFNFNWNGPEGQAKIESIKDPFKLILS